MKTTIQSVRAREILDSRGNSTVEVDLALESGVTARAATPSGASTGVHEAVEVRDGDTRRYSGRGVQNAVRAADTALAEAVVGLDAADQLAVDQALIATDGTPNKARYAANEVLAISIAAARAAAAAKGLPLWRYLADDPGLAVLPVPCMNIMNGGVHANWQGADFQEYMIAPYGAPTFTEALRWGAEVFHALKGVLKAKKHSVGVGDEGGFAPAVRSNREPLDLIVAGIEEAGYAPGREIGIALDPASSGFYEDGLYHIRTESVRLDSPELIRRYLDLVEDYPVMAIEDGLAEDDWAGWRHLKATLGERIELIGDDLFVTNVERIRQEIETRAANSVLIKSNQIGTVTETITAVELAREHGWGTRVSHLSVETLAALADRSP